MSFKQFSLFDTNSESAGDFNIDDFFGIGAQPAEKKKQTNKRPEKKTAGKKTSSRGNQAAQESVNAKPIILKGNVTVISPYFSQEIDCPETGMTGEDAIKLIAQTHPEAALGKMLFGNSKDTYILAVTEKAASDDTVLSAQNAKIYLGETHVAVTSDVLAEEVTVAEAKKHLADVYPEFTGCELAYDGRNVLAPIIPIGQVQYGVAARHKPFTILTGNGETMIDPEGKRLSVNEICTRLYGFYDPCMKLHVEESTAAICFQDSGTFTPARSGMTTVKKEEKKVMVKLPCKVSYAFKDADTVTAGNFGGKEEVELDEIVKLVQESYAAFKNGKPNFYYIPEENTVVASVITMGKGALLSICDNRLEARKKAFEEQGVYGYPEGKIYSTPTGVFAVENGSLCFERRMERIPGTILEEVCEQYQKSYPLEDASRIYFDREEERYFVVPLKLTLQTESRVNFEEETEYGVSSRYLRVVDCHSHGRFPAFLSALDLQSAIYPMIYLVVGNADRREGRTILVCACADGAVQHLQVEDIFEA